ncbi:MAG: exopolysaccharide biosynthesis polyprenyl glycosylphosphotransferase, partial [Proteobacteria bacterium]|nr:exopolysaccharide biosynthesis polyprenyl glycosylphosphotransferase [Pseudomonadota bacterium]
AWDLSILDNHIDGYRRLLKASWITFLTFSSASYIFKIQISRFVILFSLIGGTILHLILRWVFLRVADKRVNTKNNQDTWLIISPNGQVDTSAAELAVRYKVKIKYYEAFDNQKEFKSWIADLNGLLSSNSFSNLVLTSLDGLTHTQINELMWGAQQLNIEFVIHDELGFVTSQNQFKRIDDYNWLRILTPRINDSQRVVKRLFDLALVIPSLILLSPLFIAIAVAIILNSRGSVLYSQQRIGQDGKLFIFPKFRTMKPGSDAMRLEVLGRPDENMAERYKNDPRITKVGRLLRRFSLDELPQLWCVLIGTMSIVGPRPILPEEEIQLGDFHFRRQIAKPGLTGIWQVSGRKDTTWEERMVFDVKYVQEWSIGLDMILIARTFKVIVSGNGSY